MREGRDEASGLKTIELEPATEKGLLAFVLHGRGASKEDLLDLGEILAADGWRVALPDAPLPWGDGFAWYDSSSRTLDLPRSRELVGALVRARRQALNLARERVLLVGFSQGAVTSLTTALHDPALVGRVAALSGYLSPEDAPPPGPFAASLDVFLAHGTRDDVIGIQRGRAARRELEKHGVTPSYHEYPIAHGVSPEEVADLRAWLRA